MLICSPRHLDPRCALLELWQFPEFQAMIKDWELIIEEAFQEDERVKAAIASAAPTKFTLSNEISKEEKERRKNLELELSLNEEIDSESATSPDIWNKSNKGSRDRSRAQYAHRQKRIVCPCWSGVFSDWKGCGCGWLRLFAQEQRSHRRGSRRGRRKRCGSGEGYRLIFWLENERT